MSELESIRVFVDSAEDKEAAWTVATKAAALLREHGLHASWAISVEPDPVRDANGHNGFNIWAIPVQRLSDEQWKELGGEG